MPSAATRHGRALLACSAAVTVVLALHAGPAQAATPVVDVMVTGGKGTIVVGPKRVMPGQATKVVSRGPGGPRAPRTCAIPGSTPLAALRLAGIAFDLADYGSCSRKPIDSASLFVTRVGDRSGTGLAGWSYKVGNRAGTAGAADPAGPFGSGPLRSGSRVLWFWCVYDTETYACQRTLGLTAPSTAKPGQWITVRVKAWDDLGRSIAAGGARVSGCGAQSAVTGSSGEVTIPVPSASGPCVLNAVDSTGGLRPAAFPVTVRVG